MGTFIQIHRRNINAPKKSFFHLMKVLWFGNKKKDDQKDLHEA